MLSWRQAEDEDDSIDQIPPLKKGPDKPPPPDKVDMTQDDEMIQNPAQSSIPDLPAETSKSPANSTSKSPSNLKVCTAGKEEDHSEAAQSPAPDLPDGMTKSKMKWREINKNYQLNNDYNNFPPLSNLKQKQTELPSNMSHVLGSSQAQPQVDISDGDEPVEIQDASDDERSRSSAEWQLNASRLFGKVKDGVPPYFT
jgi:hypothetical protein